MIGYLLEPKSKAALDVQLIKVLNFYRQTHNLFPSNPKFYPDLILNPKLYERFLQEVPAHLLEGRADGLRFLECRVRTAPWSGGVDLYLDPDKGETDGG